MPDIPPSPLEVAAPPLTIEEAARLTGRDPRTIKLWIQQGVIKAAGHEETWPYRTLLPFEALIEIAKRSHWGTRRRQQRRLKTDRGLPIEVHNARATKVA